MMNIREFAEDTMDTVVPRIKDAGEYICVVGKNVKDGFIGNKKKITNFLSKKDNKNRVLNILMIILAVLAVIVAVLEIYDTVLKIKERKNRIKSENN